MKNIDIKKLTVAELEQRIKDTEASYQSLRLTHNISPVENPIQIRKTRREIARYKTILTQKLAEQK